MYNMIFIRVSNACIPACVFGLVTLRIFISSVVSYFAVWLQKHRAISLPLAQLQRTAKMWAVKHHHAPGRAKKLSNNLLCIVQLFILLHRSDCNRTKYGHQYCKGCESLMSPNSTTMRRRWYLVPPARRSRSSHSFLNVISSPMSLFCWRRSVTR